MPSPVRTYAPIASAAAALLTGLALAPPAASAPPRISSVYTADVDRDDSVDRATVRFSAKVRGKVRARDFSVKGYRVLRALPPRGRAVVLVLGERHDCDVGARPVVRYTGRRLRDRRRRRVRRGKLDMERRDRSAPRIVCAVTRDTNGNGRLDRVVLSYSKRVRSARQTGRKLLFSVAGRRIQSVERARGRNVELRLQESGGYDTGATPAVTYRRPSRRTRFAVRGRGGQAFNSTYKAVRDRIAPMLVASYTHDGDADGVLDAVSTGWSEPVSAAPDALAVAGARVTRAAAQGPILELGIAEEGLGTGARPALDVRGAVRDSAGNAARRGSSTPTDGAAPLIAASRTADRGGAPGRLDTLELTYSEPVAAPGGGGVPFGVTGYAVDAVDAASGARIDLRLREGSAPDTALRPPVGYVRGSGAPVRDAAGNEAAGQAFAGTVDGVAPKLLSATTRDGDGDGRTDGVEVHHSETVAGGGTSQFAVAGRTITSAVAAGGTMVLALQEETFDTDARPGVGYTPGDLADSAGNRAGPGWIGQAADGARPIAVAAATADSDSDMRVDRIDVTMSEPVSGTEDATAPFSFSAGGFQIERVDDAAGASVPVRLVEPAAPDTGSAPTLTYTAGGTRVLDAGGLESPTRGYPGLTRDALAPRLVSAVTADADADGRLDRIDLGYSESMSMSSAAAPFSVAGRTLTAATATADEVRLALAESGPDTDATPAVGYAPGDLADIPEGDGDTADPAAALDAQPTQDRAKPAIVEALTQDVNANGTIDRLRTTFSEPVSHVGASSAPFALAASGRTLTAVSPSAGAVVTADVAEGTRPDGGAKPSVWVTSPSSILDLAATPNPAQSDSFAGTTDGVRPVLISAQMGESAGGGCGGPPVNGRIDCIRTTWSENVKHAQDPSFGLGSGYLFDASTGISATGAADDADIDVPVQEKGVPDRDKTADVSYDEAAAVPVTDAVDNSGLTKSVTARAACADNAFEDNEARTVDNPTLSTEASPQRLCAADDDWFRIIVPGDDLKVVIRPGGSLGTTAELYGAGADPLESSTATPAGAAHVLGGANNVSAGTYWLRITAPVPQEGSYCLDVSLDEADEPSCGPNEGEVIFTEAGLDGAGGGRFVEVKNVSDYPIDISQFRLHRGVATCGIGAPGGGALELQPGDYAVGTATGAGADFGCSEIGSLTAGDGDPATADAGDRLKLTSGAGETPTRIDEVDLTGVLDSSRAGGHSLELKPTAENNLANDAVAANWCRTWAAHTRGGAGDGCDEYRVNEVLFHPEPAGADGKAFVELGGNLPAKPSSALLGSWMLTTTPGHSVENGQPVDVGTPETLILPPGASPNTDGLYVVGDALPDGSTTLVSGANLAWSAFDPKAGPRGVQVLRPDPPSDSCPSDTLADAFGWSITDAPFTVLTDDARSCKIVEGEPYTVGAVGKSAARANLAHAGATQYIEGNDTDRNGGVGTSSDFCPQDPPSPGALNARPAC